MIRERIILKHGSKLLDNNTHKNKCDSLCMIDNILKFHMKVSKDQSINNKVTKYLEKKAEN